MDEDRESEAGGKGGEQADGEVGIGDRGHAGDGGEEDDEGGDEEAALEWRRGAGKMRWKDVAAADELVAGDGGVGRRGWR